MEIEATYLFQLKILLKYNCYGSSTTNTCILQKIITSKNSNHNTIFQEQRHYLSAVNINLILELGSNIIT